MTARVNLGKACPNLYQQLAQLDKLATEAATSANLAAGLTHLLRLRASQINGCAFCLEKHSQALRKGGMAQSKLDALAGWRVSAHFTPRARAALAGAEVKDVGKAI